MLNLCIDVKLLDVLDSVKWWHNTGNYASFASTFLVTSECFLAGTLDYLGKTTGE